VSAHLNGTDDKQYVQYTSQTCVGFNNSVILLLFFIINFYFYNIRTWHVILFKPSKHCLKTFIQTTYPVYDGILGLFVFKYLLLLQFFK